MPMTFRQAVISLTPHSHKLNESRTLDLASTKDESCGELGSGVEAIFPSFLPFVSLRFKFNVVFQEPAIHFILKEDDRKG